MKWLNEGEINGRRNKPQKSFTTSGSNEVWLVVAEK